MNLNTVQDPVIFFDTLIHRIPKNVKTAIIITLFFAIIIHGFMLTNDLPNHDDVNQLYTNYKYYVNLGRWFTQVPAAFSSSYSLQWLSGVLGFIYLSVALGLIVHIWRIKSTPYLVLSSLIFISFPSIFETLPYSNNFDAYSFGFLLACISVHITTKYKFGFIGGVILLCLSTATYQAYFPIAAVLYVGLLVIDILKNIDLIKVVRKSVSFILVLTFALVLYLISVKVSLLLTGTSLRDYKGISSMGQIEIQRIPYLIVRAYQSFFEFYIADNFSIHNNAISIGIIAFGVISMIMLVIFIIKTGLYKSSIKLGFFLVMLATTSLALSLICIMVPDAPIKLMMLYTYPLCWILLLSILEKQNQYLHSFSIRKFRPFVSRLFYMYRWLSIIFIFYLSLNYTIITNIQYQKLFFAYENTYAFYSRLTSAVQSIEGYSTNLPLYFIGRYRMDTFLPKEFYTFKNIVGIDEDLVSTYSTYRFLKYYMAFPNDLITLSYEEFLESELYFPGVESVYPDWGSIKINDKGIFVFFKQ